MKPDPTIFVVDDDESVRKLISQLFRSVRLPVEGFASASDFLSSFDANRPGCLVLDIRIPAMSGLELQRTLKERGCLLPIVILTGYADVPTAVQTIKAGAFDYVEKPFQNQKFLDVVQAALRHDSQLRARRERHENVESRLAALTKGEREVLDRMMVGKGYKSIASDLDISYKTVQARRAQIMKKMEVDDLPQLVHLMMAMSGDVSAA